MYSWLDRAEYRPPCRDFPLRVDREAACDDVQAESVRWRLKRRKLWSVDRAVKAAKTRSTRKSVTVATPLTSTVCGAATLPSPWVAPVDTYAGIQRAPIPDPPWWHRNPPRKMTDEQARELY